MIESFDPRRVAHADRDVIFACRLESDQVVQSREMYSAIYPATECDEQAALCLIENVDWFIPPLYRRL
jgi:deoxycytidylate deaminase